ncbi:MAG TPA: radical SAM protein [Rhizomicrobium sp.]|nr:radical SAM protein [Rhizomicrobium sp.]
MLRYLLNDFVIQEQVCNLRCVYCLNFENELKGVVPWTAQERPDLSNGGAGFVQAKAMLENAAQYGDAPILKLSGGEIFSLPGAMDFIEWASERWDRVQILTNATLFNEPRIARLKRLGNVNLCLSLDGSTPEANALRTPAPRLAMRIIDGVRAVVQAGIPCEIYTVVTGHNYRHMDELVAWLAGLARGADLRFVPFPIRGEAARKFAAPADAAAVFQGFAERNTAMAEVLLPAVYYDILGAYYDAGRRTRRCRIPLTHLQSFDDGVIAACPNCWSSAIGNLAKEGDPFAEIGRAKIQRLFLKDTPRVPFCRNCITPFDIVNLYFDGEVSDAEMQAIDLFRTPAVMNRLRVLKRSAGRDAVAFRDVAMLPEVGEALYVL